MTYQHSPLLMITGKPLHADAIQSYLQGFYTIKVILQHARRDDVRVLDRYLARHDLVAVLVDDTVRDDPLQIAAMVHEYCPQLGLIYLDATPNLFRVQAYLAGGYRGYLDARDALADLLRGLVDRVRHGERVVSPSIRLLYRQTDAYLHMVAGLTETLRSILRLMGEGLTNAQIMQRTGLDATVLYRRQYRLRQHFGVETNAELVDLVHGTLSEVKTPAASR